MFTAIEAEFYLEVKDAEISVALLFAPLTHSKCNFGRLSLRPVT